MKALIAFPLFALVLASACVAPGYGPAAPTTPTAPTTSTNVTPTGIVKTVKITSTGFDPQTITVNVGDTVTWINEDSAPHWPASFVHPTHCVYKGCNVFDAKKSLQKGESYSLVFDLAGNWGYHDHLNPGTTGTVVVK